MSDLHTIGVLTSGGDAPGMNAVVRAVVRSARFNKVNVKGILRGYNGLMHRDMVDMTLSTVSSTMQRGGTILHTARCPEFKEDAGVEQAKNICIEEGIDGLIVCGGDGSFRGARDLSLKGIPCIAVPCTIDNDIACTEYTVGFDTAVNTVIQNIDKLRDTTASHSRCSVVEVMGRKCGDIALHAAISCGAETVLLPEVNNDIDRDVVDRMLRWKGIGKNHFIVIIAEGVAQYDPSNLKSMSSDYLAKYIQQRTGIETRATVIGHVQRGGAPMIRDRVIASQMGHYAVELLLSGQSNRVVALKNNRVVDYDIYEALSMIRDFDQDLYRVFSEIS